MSFVTCAFVINSYGRVTRPQTCIVECVYVFKSRLVCAEFRHPLGEHAFERMNPLIFR